MTRTRLDEAANTLRAAGLTVVIHPGAERRGSAFTDCTALVWHHDASALGDSPGVPGYMARQIDAGKPGAQFWVNRYGVWTIVATGRVSHAGAVRPGMPSNSTSAGVETDHTTGEDWPPALLASLRLGTAALLKSWARTSSALHFHKTICDPPGRKPDPDGLDLGPERGAVTRLLTAPPAAPSAPVKPAPGAPRPVTWDRSRPGVMIPATQAEHGGVKAPAWPLPRGSYFGPRTGPAASVSGYHSHREDLRRWQTQMARRGWKISADGLWGPESATVAAQFQRDKGLAVDGLVGPITWTASWSTPVT